jgi:hypothetical protein
VDFNSFGITGGLGGRLAFDTVNDEVRIVHSGVYLFNIQVSLTGWTPAAATEFARIRATIVSGGNNLTGTTVLPSAPGVPLTLSMNFSRKLNAGDTVAFEVFQNSGTAKTVIELNQTHIDVVQLN